MFTSASGSSETSRGGLHSWGADEAQVAAEGAVVDYGLDVVVAGGEQRAVAAGQRDLGETWAFAQHVEDLRRGAQRGEGKGKVRLSDGGGVGAAVVKGFPG
jgi:hypothetical protein